ncbi:hypothetical protein AYI70_g1486, partial [Smittium culicis]
MKLFCES